MSSVDEMELFKAIATIEEPGSLESVKLLLERGVDPNARKSTDKPGLGMTLLHVALYRPNANTTECVKMLLDAGADPNSTYGVYGTTPLMLAVRNGAVKTLPLLVQRGCDLDAKNAAGNTVEEHATNDMMVYALLLCKIWFV